MRTEVASILAAASIMSAGSRYGGPWDNEPTGVSSGSGYKGSGGNFKNGKAGNKPAKARKRAKAAKQSRKKQRGK